MEHTLLRQLNWSYPAPSAVLKEMRHAAKAGLASGQRTIQSLKGIGPCEQCTQAAECTVHTVAQYDHCNTVLMSVVRDSHGGIPGRYHTVYL